ncbi:MAG: SAM-dependent methyltransferase [Pseudomonadota bacterium]
MRLPQPTPDALAASQALVQHICAEIEAHAGWISFAHYMELALYAPRLGYYSGGAAKLGKDGDFTTAPEITPLFGATLAHVAAGLMAQSRPQVLEFGAGTGKLAHDILSELTAAGITVERYYIVELSGELRARQELALRDFPQVEWLETFPSAFSGVVIGNEVLDAMPVALVLKTEQGWNELGVAVTEQGLGYCEKACAPDLLAHIAAYIPEPDFLPPGYVTEVHPVACGFMASLAQTLQAGAGAAAILIDYGFPAHEYYLAQRSQGTLMCHYRHHAHPDPFYLPGLQDITAHVDFSAMARAAQDAGLSVLGYTSQAAFLMDAGIGDLLLRTAPDDPQRYLPQANAVQKLLSPAEMGELFKVLVVGVRLDLPAAFERNDRCHRL